MDGRKVGGSQGEPSTKGGGKEKTGEIKKKKQKKKHREKKNGEGAQKHRKAWNWGGSPKRGPEKKKKTGF